MSTRQATPGPSNETILQPQPVNSKKRVLSDADGETGCVPCQKKSKQDSTTEAARTSNKEKKKRRKRKRKLSVVVPTSAPVEVEELRSRSRSRLGSNTATTQPPTRASSKKPDADIYRQAEAAGALETTRDADTSSIVSVNKGKGKARESREGSQQPTISTSVESPAEQIARLTKELAAQTQLLRRHQTHLTHTQQSLTCQICLDLLHKPFALAPCGHVACHGCLVRWFTASNGNNARGQQRASYINRKKTCPVCRTIIVERPVEVWGVKSMVAALVRSGLVDLPVPPPEGDEDAPTQLDGNADPWRRIFRPLGRGRSFFDPFPPEENGPRGELTDVGMYDAEDGGIYRCIDCMHEIWDGSCSNCHRAYPGHQAADDGIDAAIEGGAIRGREMMLRNFIGMLARGQDAFDDQDEDSDIDFDGPDVFGDDDEDDGDSDEDDDVDDPDFSVTLLDHYRQHSRNFALGGFNTTRHDLPMHPFYPVAGMPGPMRAFFGDEDEEDNGIARIDGELVEEGYESSFIDDDADEADEGYTHGWTPTQLITASSEDEDSEGIQEHLLVRGTTRRRTHDIVVLSDENEDEGVTRIARSSHRIGGRRPLRREVGNRPIIISDDDSSSEIEVVGRRSQRRVHDLDGRGTGTRRRRRSFNVGNSDNESDSEHDSQWSDDDERGVYEEDDSIPGPSSRLQRLMEQEGVDN